MPTLMTDIPLVRLHPIADAHHGWVALLLGAPPSIECHDMARLFGEFGLFEALGQLPCVVDVGSPKCSDEIDALVPAERIVLRLPAAACVAEADCQNIGRLRELGFHVMATGLPPAGQALCPGVDALAMACGDDSAAPSLPAGMPGRHLALEVNSPLLFERCRQAGFQWLAGDYPLHPTNVPHGAGATRHALLLQLLTLISRDAESHEIEEVIKQDAHLSYQLLRLVNSVAFSLSNKITSFGQAIMLLGRRQLQRWLQLLLYARPEGNGKSPLLPRAAVRAAMMEALCANEERGVQDRAFMAGMFSLLDIMLGSSLARIVEPLNLTDDVVQALLERTGPLGPAMRVVDAAERRDDTLAAALADAGVDATAWTIALVRSYRWAIRVSAEA
jgi:EAL and modified HD-GYP domain-containing signal transduction protein